MSARQSKQYWEQREQLVSGGGQPQLNANALKLIEIPLPPLEEQRRIVAEIEGYQKVLDGARQILAGYKPELSRSIQTGRHVSSQRCRDIIPSSGQECLAKAFQSLKDVPLVRYSRSSQTGTASRR